MNSRNHVVFPPYYIYILGRERACAHAGGACPSPAPSPSPSSGRFPGLPAAVAASTRPLILGAGGDLRSDTPSSVPPLKAHSQQCALPGHRSLSPHAGVQGGFSGGGGVCAIPAPDSERGSAQTRQAARRALQSTPHSRLPRLTRREAHGCPGTQRGRRRLKARGPEHQRRGPTRKDPNRNEPGPPSRQRRPRASGSPRRQTYRGERRGGRDVNEH